MWCYCISFHWHCQFPNVEILFPSPHSAFTLMNTGWQDLIQSFKAVSSVFCLLKILFCNALSIQRSLSCPLYSHFSSVIMCSDFKATGKEYTFLKKKLKLGFQLKETVKIVELHIYIYVSHKQLSEAFALIFYKCLFVYVYTFYEHIQMHLFPFVHKHVGRHMNTHTTFGLIFRFLYWVWLRWS